MNKRPRSWDWESGLLGLLGGAGAIAVGLWGVWFQRLVAPHRLAMEDAEAFLQGAGAVVAGVGLVMLGLALLGAGVMGVFRRTPPGPRSEWLAGGLMALGSVGVIAAIVALFI